MRELTDLYTLKLLINNINKIDALQNGETDKKEWFYKKCSAVETYKFNRKQEIEKDSLQIESQSLGLTYSSQQLLLNKKIQAICGQPKPPK